MMHTASDVGTTVGQAGELHVQGRTPEGVVGYRKAAAVVPRFDIGSGGRTCSAGAWPAWDPSAMVSSISVEDLGRDAL